MYRAGAATRGREPGPPVGNEGRAGNGGAGPEGSPTPSYDRMEGAVPEIRHFLFDNQRKLFPLPRKCGIIAFGEGAAAVPTGREAAAVGEPAC